MVYGGIPVSVPGGECVLNCPLDAQATEEICRGCCEQLKAQSSLKNCGCYRGLSVWNLAMEYPSEAPSQTSDGKCAASVMREKLMAVASVYDRIGIHGLPRC